MRFTVGKRPLDLTQQQVAAAMHGVQPEDIREHVVEMHHTVYPPKQVLATVTGWDRQSFTTMEAQRVLSRLGFTCRRAGHDSSGRPAWVRQDDELNAEAPPENADRLEVLEATLRTALTAIAGLAARVEKLEAA